MNNIRRRIFEIISVGNRKDLPSTFFDIALVVAILLNLFATFMGTYSELQKFSRTFYVIEAVTSVLFLIEYNKNPHVCKLCGKPILMNEDDKYNDIFRKFK